MFRALLILLIFFFSLSNVLSQASNLIKFGRKAYKTYAGFNSPRLLPIVQGTNRIIQEYNNDETENPRLKDWNPKLESYFTQNVNELQSILNYKEKVIDASSAFSKNKITNDLSVDSLTMPSKAIQDILVNGNTEGRSSFLLEDVIPVGQEIKGGIYTANSKISLGDDGAGNKFFDISHTYKPGDQVPYFGIPSDATKTSFRNRLYYKPNEKSASEIRINNVNLGIKKLREYKSFQTAKSPVRKLLTDFD